MYICPYLNLSLSLRDISFIINTNLYTTCTSHVNIHAWVCYTCIYTIYTCKLMTWKEDDIGLLITPVHLCLVEAFNWQDLGQNLRPRNQKSRKTLHFLRKAPKRITICQAIFWLPWWLGEGFAGASPHRSHSHHWSDQIITTYHNPLQRLPKDF